MDKKSESVSLHFANNTLLTALFGDGDKNLLKLEKAFSIKIASRGNMLALTGDANNTQLAKQILEELYARLERGDEINSAEVDAAIRIIGAPHPKGTTTKGNHNRVINTAVGIKTLKKTVHPYSAMQTQYIEALESYDMVFALGPAGTGKTYLAVAQAVAAFLSQRVDRIILSRPAVEAGEKLGFLPGDLKDKIDPYLRPLYDALFDMLPGERVMKHIENGEIEVAPLAFMRGRTLSNAYVILDEAQNTTATQMKMFLTRMGENSRMVITGDLSQTDLPRDVKSGLGDAIKKVENIEGIKCIRFSDVDVVRHTLAARIVQAYDEWERKKRV